MRAAENKLEEIGDIKAHSQVRPPPELEQLLKPETKSSLMTVGRDLRKATDLITELEPDLKIAVCDAKEKREKAKQGQVLLCQISDCSSDVKLGVLMEDVPKDSHHLNQLQHCERLSQSQEMLSINCAKDAAELTQLLRRQGLRPEGP